MNLYRFVDIRLSHSTSILIAPTIHTILLHTT